MKTELVGYLLFSNLKARMAVEVKVSHKFIYKKKPLLAS